MKRKLELILEATGEKGKTTCSQLVSEVSKLVREANYCDLIDNVKNRKKITSEERNKRDKAKELFVLIDKKLVEELNKYFENVEEINDKFLRNTRFEIKEDEFEGFLTDYINNLKGNTKKITQEQIISSSTLSR